MSSDDYKPGEERYYAEFAKDGVKHCVGNSCDNLVGMCTIQEQDACLQVRSFARNNVLYTQRAHRLISSTYTRTRVDAQIATGVTAPPPQTTSQKPLRSEAQEGCCAPTSPTLASSQQPVYVRTEDAETFVKSDYYAEIRRRSLEGRCPVRFQDTGAHPLEETIASEEFDVALY